MAVQAEGQAAPAGLAAVCCTWREPNGGPALRLERHQTRPARAVGFLTAKARRREGWRAMFQAERV
jgi:hypothetical protein